MVDWNSIYGNFYRGREITHLHILESKRIFLWRLSLCPWGYSLMKSWNVFFVPQGGFHALSLRISLGWEAWELTMWPWLAKQWEAWKKVAIRGQSRTTTACISIHIDYPVVMTSLQYEARQIKWNYWISLRDPNFKNIPFFRTWRNKLLKNLIKLLLNLPLYWRYSQAPSSTIASQQFFGSCRTESCGQLVQLTHDKWQRILNGNILHTLCRQGCS